MISLAGSATNDAGGHSEDEGDGDHAFIFRDVIVTPIQNGTSTTTIEFSTGWKAGGNADGDADGDATNSFSLAPDGTAAATSNVVAEVDGESDGQGKDLTYLMYQVVGNQAHDVTANGPYGPARSHGTRNSLYKLTYRSQNDGELDGDADGDATEDSSSASVDSDVDGNGDSLLVILDMVDGVGDTTGPDATGIKSDGADEHWITLFVITGKFRLDGDISANRANAGSIGFSIDTNVNGEYDIKYRALWDHYSYNVHSVEGDYAIYDFVRLAKFDVHNVDTASANGGGSISPQPGGDTGSANGSGSSTRIGDTEVIVTVSGVHDGSLFDLTGVTYAKYPWELELEGSSGSSGNDDDSGGGSSSGGGSGAGGGSGNASNSGGSVGWAAAGGFFAGLAQGACNLVNGVQDAAVGVANLAIAVPNTIAGGIDYATGVTDTNYQIRVPYIPSPDWSRNLVTEEGGTPGGWDDSHGWSKFAGGEAAMSLATGGASKAATAVDDAGRCANWFAKFVRGGCFVAGTFVTVCEMPYSQARETALWSETDWLDETLSFGHSVEHKESQISTLNSKHLLIPIEQVPIGARVPTKNPRPWEYDDSLPDPVQNEWGLIAMTMVREDGGIVDAEFIRPWAWIRSHRIEVGKPLPMNIPELQVTGVAMVKSIGKCPAIADGEGSVITARFLTREVHSIVRAEILGPDGSTEIIEGTPVHPIWSVDRNDWVPISELIEGETLQAANGTATVVSNATLKTAASVYNVEVHGEHVYEIGNLALLVHNTCAGFNDEMRDALKWLDQNGFDASSASPFKSRFSNVLNGMRDGSKGYRIEFDARSGAHINVFAGKTIGPQFMFKGSAADVAAVLRQLFGG